MKIKGRKEIPMKKNNITSTIGDGVPFKRDFDIDWMIGVLSKFKEQGATRVEIQKIYAGGGAMHLPDEVVGRELVAYCTRSETADEYLSRMGGKSDI